MVLSFCYRISYWKAALFTDDQNEHLLGWSWGDEFCTNEASVLFFEVLSIKVKFYQLLLACHHHLSKYDNKSIACGVGEVLLFSYFIIYLLIGVLLSLPSELLGFHLAFSMVGSSMLYAVDLEGWDLCSFSSDKLTHAGVTTSVDTAPKGHSRGGTVTWKSSQWLISRYCNVRSTSERKEETRSSLWELCFGPGCIFPAHLLRLGSGEAPLRSCLEFFICLLHQFFLHDFPVFFFCVLCVFLSTPARALAIFFI